MGALFQGDLTLVQGEDFSSAWIFASADPSGFQDLSKMVYLNLTGATLAGQIRQAEDPSSTLVLDMATAGCLSLQTKTPLGNAPTPTAPNAIQIAFTPTQTKLFANNATYFYDVFFLLSGILTLAMKGRVRVPTTVTR